MSTGEILKAGYAAAKSGNRAQATSLFAQVVQIDPSSEQGWLGLGFCVSEPRQREHCFRRVLAINPDNRIAREQLARLSKPEQTSASEIVKLSPFVEASKAPKPVESAILHSTSTQVGGKTLAISRQELPVARTGAEVPKTSPKAQTPKAKKKSNTPLIVALAAIAVFIIGFSILLIGYGVSYLSTPANVAVNPLLTQKNTKILPTATPALNPTLAPSPIPSPVPTVVYKPIYENISCPFDAPSNVWVNCGYLIVPEDRTGDPSHTIKLMVAVYHSQNSKPSEPVIFLQGGPGAEAVMLSSRAYGVLVAPFISKHDFIVIDQRGTGLSEPALKCDEFTKMYTQDIHGAIASSTRDLVYGNALRSCKDLMTAQGIKLKAYTTAESAADVRDLLAVLNYPKVDLYGVSYGTRLTQVIMREYPELVNVAILDSVVPVDTSIFGNYANAAASGLKTLFTNCANDPQCNTAYPNLETTFWDLVKQLDTNPITVTSSNYPTGTITQTVTGETVINLVLGSIKNAPYISSAPQIISRFKNGDFSTLVMQQSSLLFTFDDINPGVFINMTCHEQVLSTTLQKAQTEANREIIREYSWLPFYGGIDDVFKTCKTWGAVAPAYNENTPTVSDIPSLIIAGSYDPTTPPVYARQIAAHLNHSYFFEFPNLGHAPTAVDSSGCAMHIVQQFIDNPSSEPDRTCINQIEPTSFVVPYTGNPPITLKTEDAYGLKLKVPKGWQSAGQGFYFRGNSPFDITEVGILILPVNTAEIEDWFSLKAYGYRGLDGPLIPAGQRTEHGFTWKLYTSSSYGRPVDIAMFDTRGWTIGIVQFCNKDEHDALYQTLFLPMIDSLIP